MAEHRAPTTHRARVIVVGICTAALVTLVGIGAEEASAAPITCPGGQVATQVAPGQFACVNPAGNADNSAQPKNPND